MNEDEPLTIEITVTCHTTGCENADIPITLTTVEGAQVVCGPCGAELLTTTEGE